MKKSVTTYSATPQSAKVLKEQLRLQAFGSSSSMPSVSLEHVKKGLSNRERLSVLLEGELNFHGESSGYASHDLHAFAAKFPPQLPRTFIRGLTHPGDLVLDPMMGSGTTIVEAFLEGRIGLGFDIDPLALRLTQVKTSPTDTEKLYHIGVRVLASADEWLSDGRAIDKALSRRFDEPTKAFLDYWFLPETQRELLALVLAIQKENDVSVRNFLELTFSSIIVTKSGGVSRARDLAHSRPHLDETKPLKNSLEQFSAKFRKNLISISRLKSNGISAFPMACDARLMPLADQVVDLIVTSPPYANAIDYMRAHKFSLVWLGENLKELSNLRSEYIGSERTRGASFFKLPQKPESIIQHLSQHDCKKAAILQKYFVDMKVVFSEMYRVLRYNSVAVVVVGSSTMRGIDVETHLCLADLAAETGFDIVGMVKRHLDRNKRMMPARFNQHSSSGIEQRIHEEYVIGLMKPNLS